MKLIQNTIGAFDAKTHLSDLLAKTEQGQEFTITKRGKPIAKLVPISDKTDQQELDSVLKELREIRKSVKQPVDIREYIEEGRR